MLVGREAELAAITRLLAGARVGRSGVLVLTGEPGVGKTALLERVLGDVRDMLVLRSSATAAERALGFAALSQVLRPVLHALEAIPVRQAEALRVALALSSGETVDRFAVGAATLSLLSHVAEQRPVLLVLDDAHELDPPSQEALAFVARRLLADRVAVLAACRPEGGVPLLDAGLPELPVSGLDVGAVSSLLTQRAGSAARTDLVARLHRATGGNPLAIVELASDLAELERHAPRTPVPVPETVAGVFTCRIVALERSAQVALLLASVADGDVVVFTRAARSLGVDVTDLEPAEAAGLVRLTPGGVEFRHPLVRSSAYAAAPEEERRSAHRAVAGALGENDFEQRAWHLCEATVGLDDAVAALVETVGNRAWRRGAHEVAATAFERAALLTLNEGTRSGRFLAAGESAWLAGQVGRAEMLLQQAASGACEPEPLARIDGLRGSIAAHSGSLERARTLLTDAAERIALSEPDHAMLLLGEAINVCFYLGASQRAVEIAESLRGLLGRAASADARRRASLAVGIANVIAGREGIDRIRAAIETMSPATGREQDQRSPAWEVLGALFLRESEAGRVLVHGTVRRLRESTALAVLPTALFYVARDDATTDRWPAAAAGYREAMSLARETGQTTDLVACLAGLAWLQARTGRAGECRAHADEAIRLGSTYGIHLAVAWARFALAELDLATGSTGDALARLEGLDGMLEEIGFADVDVSPGPELAEALQQLGHIERARVTAHRYHARAVSKGQPWALARAERALALTAESDVAVTRFDAALRLHRGTPDVFEEARTRLHYGSALRRHRQRRAAQPLLRAALDIFERLGATPWAETAARELRAAGETPRRRGGEPLDTLTGQEWQIARRLGNGQTTREAAAALFLSPKTVEYHLRHVYTKLGIRSRAELAAYLSEAGSFLVSPE